MDSAPGVSAGRTCCLGLWVLVSGEDCSLLILTVTWLKAENGSKGRGQSRCWITRQVGLTVRAICACCFWRFGVWGCQVTYPPVASPVGARFKESDEDPLHFQLDYLKNPGGLLVYSVRPRWNRGTVQFPTFIPPTLFLLAKPWGSCQGDKGCTSLLLTILHGGSGQASTTTD